MRADRVEIRRRFEKTLDQKTLLKACKLRYICINNVKEMLISALTPTCRQLAVRDPTGRRRFHRGKGEFGSRLQTRLSTNGFCL